jgi:hypothetical protein
MASRSLVLAIASLFVFGGAGTAVADETCDVPQFFLPSGGSMTITMSVKQGKFCIQNLSASFKTDNSFKVTERARHGFVGTSGVNGWVYKPMKGYVGPDRYVLKISGNTMILGPAVSTLTVDVTVHK